MLVKGDLYGAKVGILFRMTMVEVWYDGCYFFV